MLMVFLLLNIADVNFKIMDDEYILPHLLSWAKLFYSKKKKFCIAYKKKDYYYFGGEKKNKKVINKIGKPLAIYLSIINIKKLKEALK